MSEQVNINVNETNENINITSTEIVEVIDINVGETIEEVTLNITEEVIQVNINKVTGGGGNQNLQEVTDNGNTTTNDISLLNSSVLLDNGSRLKKGTTDAGNGGNKGIALKCSLDYELKWEAGRKYIMEQDGITIREVSYNFTNIPTTNDDNTKGFVVDSRWILDNGDVYVCTDATTSNAVWELQIKQVNSDWNATSGVAEILNKPSIPTNTSDLTNDSNFVSDANYVHTDNNFTNTLKTKLDGIADGAEVNVNADWNATSGDALILNKPTIPSLTGYVPYTGATTDLDLGTYNLTADHIALNTNPSGAGFVVGATQWNNTNGSSQTLLKGGNVTLKNGVDLIARVVNKVTPNTTLTKAQYQVVKVSGAIGQRLAVDLAQANNDNNSADTLGIVIETIATNQEGFILTLGQLEGINTTGSLQGETWSDGDVLYLSPTTAGRITNIKPTGATGHIVVLGYVEHAHITQGKIYVKIMNGWELDELHNVYINTPLNNQGLIYETSTSLWKNKTIDKTFVGLGNVDNTSDVNKPISTATQTALNAKQNASTRRNANNTTNNNINYCGVALGTGVSESSAVWTITRLTIAASGSITTAIATNVAWTNRQSATYI